MQWPLRKLSGREKEYPCRDSWSIPSSRTLVHHPEFNRRLLGRSIHGFKEVNVPRPIRHARERRADIVLLRNIDRHSLADIAADLWQQAHDAARGEFQYDPPTRLYRSLPQRLRRHLLRFQVWLNNNWNLPADRGSERQRCAAVLINYPGFDGAAPLRSFKPSRLPPKAFRSVSPWAGQNRGRSPPWKGYWQSAPWHRCSPMLTGGSSIWSRSASWYSHSGKRSAIPSDSMRTLPHRRNCHQFCALPPGTPAAKRKLIASPETIVKHCRINLPARTSEPIAYNPSGRQVHHERRRQRPRRTGPCPGNYLSFGTLPRKRQRRECRILSGH